MGICYHLILESDCMVWDEESSLKAFEEEWAKTGYIKKIASFDNFIVYNVEKSCPLIPERLKLIRKYWDVAYYSSDHTDGLHKLNLPYIKTEQELMDGRRTYEEKKASEEAIRQKLLTDPKYRDMKI